jgi:hypothetical protein
MKTWMVITEIFLLGLWIDDWGLGIQDAMAHQGRAIRGFKTLTPTYPITTLTSLSNESSEQRWYCPTSVRPPPLAGMKTARFKNRDNTI